MKYESFDSEGVATWKLRDDEGGWIVCAIDDHWEQAPRIAARHELANEAERQQVVRSYAPPYGVNLAAVALLPYFAHLLTQVNRLHVVRFPKEDADPFFDNFLDRLPIERTAFLVDVWEDDKQFKTGELMVLPKLLAKDIPASRVVLFTVGVAVDGEYSYLLKSDLVLNNGKALLDWWERVRDSIDYFFFEETTRRHGGHEPSTILTELDEPWFKTFVRELAVRDKYGVWQWVESVVLASTPTKVERQYAWACGKAFLRCGQDSNCYFTAVRALGHGLARIVSNTAAVSVIEPTIPAAYTSDVDELRFCGGCTTGGEQFEVAARALREWLKLVQAAPRGNARVQTISVGYDAGGSWIKVRFSEQLASSILDGTGIGTVTGGWKELRRVMPTAQALNGQEVLLGFPKL